MPESEEDNCGHQEENYENPPLLIDPASYEKRNSDTAQEDKNAKNRRWYSETNNWQAVFSACLVFAAFIAAGISWYQGGIAQQTVSEIRRQTFSANKSAQAAEQAARIAERNSRDTGDQFRLDQRAWISVDTAQVINEMKIGETLTVDVTIKNTGKTPANRLRIRSKSINRIPIRSDYSQLSAPREQLALAPSGGFTKRFRSTTKFGPEIDSIESGVSTFYLFGDITYYDVFKRGPFTTAFCMWYSPKDKPFLRFCEDGNYIQ